jgi:hypothetical protein
VIERLQRGQGSTIATIVKATGWQPALGAAQAQKAVGQDAGFEKGIEVSFDEDARSRH